MNFIRKRVIVHGRGKVGTVYLTHQSTDVHKKKTHEKQTQNSGCETSCFEACVELIWH